MRIDVQKLQAALFFLGIIPSKTEIATGRAVYYEVFDPVRPTVHIITDGNTKKITRSGKAGLIEYEITDDPSFVLIMFRDENRGRWVIERAFFAHKDFVRSKQLKDQLRVFCGPDYENGILEQLLDAVFLRTDDKSH